MYSILEVSFLEVLLLLPSHYGSVIEDVKVYKHLWIWPKYSCARINMKWTNSILWFHGFLQIQCCVQWCICKYLVAVSMYSIRLRLDWLCTHWLRFLNVQVLNTPYAKCIDSCKLRDTCLQYIYSNEKFKHIYLHTQRVRKIYRVRTFLWTLKVILLMTQNSS